MVHRVRYNYTACKNLGVQCAQQFLLKRKKTTFAIEDFSEIEYNALKLVNGIKNWKADGGNSLEG